MGVPAGLRPLPPRRVWRAKPWLNGAIYWALNEFRIRPALGGRQPAARAARAPEGAAALRHVGAQAGVERTWRGSSRASGSTARHPRARRGVAARAADGRGWASASRPGPRRRSRAGCARRAAGCRPSGAAWAGDGSRSLPPPPPPSSSSGGGHDDAVSERRNIMKSTIPSVSATRCSAPKITISSSSGDITRMLPPDRGWRATASLACPAAHGRIIRQLQHARTDRPRRRGIPLGAPPAPHRPGARRHLRRRRRAAARSPSTRASCATRWRIRARSSRSRSTAERPPRCSSRTCSAIPCAATPCTSTSCAWT